MEMTQRETELRHARRGSIEAEANPRALTETEIEFPAPIYREANNDYNNNAPDVTRTHFGLVNTQGEFVNSRCSAFNYNRHGYVKIASTFKARHCSSHINSPSSKGLRGKSGSIIFGSSHQAS